MKAKLLYLIILVETVILCTLFFYPKKEVKHYQEDSEIFITAAHIQMDTERYESIYTDVNRDVAIYRDKDYRPKVPKIGQRLFIGNVSCEVISIDYNGFIVAVDDYTQIEFGMSGTSILSENGYKYGFVSSLLKENLVYCILT